MQISRPNPHQYIPMRLGDCASENEKWRWTDITGDPRKRSNSQMQREVAGFRFCRSSSEVGKPSDVQVSERAVDAEVFSKRDGADGS